MHSRPALLQAAVCFVAFAVSVLYFMVFVVFETKASLELEAVILPWSLWYWVRGVSHCTQLLLCCNLVPPLCSFNPGHAHTERAVS